MEPEIFLTFCPALLRSVILTASLGLGLSSQVLAGLAQSLHELLAVRVELIKCPDAAHLVLRLRSHRQFGSPSQCQLSRGAIRVLMFCVEGNAGSARGIVCVCSYVAPTATACARFTRNAPIVCKIQVKILLFRLLTRAQSFSSFPLRDAFIFSLMLTSLARFLNLI